MQFVCTNKQFECECIIKVRDTSTKPLEVSYPTTCPYTSEQTNWIKKEVE